MAARLGFVVAGKYKLMELVGAGAFGEVYRAEHLALGKSVAVKLLRPEHTRDRQAIRRFEEEARRAASVSHPGVVEVHDIGALDDGAPYQIMELLSGLSLAHELRHHRELPIGRAVAIVAQVLEALTAVHAAGIVHRDLKPENIFLQRDIRGERVKIVDFGIAKVLGGGKDSVPLTAAGKPLGTPYYMPPEQGIDPSRVDARADVYAVGATLFELLAGRTVVLPADLVVVLGHVIAGDIERHPRVHRTEVPVWLDGVVARALAQRPSERFADAADMLAALKSGQREAAGAGPIAGARARARTHDDFDETTRRSASRAGEITGSGQEPTSPGLAGVGENIGGTAVVVDPALGAVLSARAEETTLPGGAGAEPTRAPPGPAGLPRAAPAASTAAPPRPSRLAGGAPPSSSGRTTDHVEPLPAPRAHPKILPAAAATPSIAPRPLSWGRLAAVTGVVALLAGGGAAAWWLRRPVLPVARAQRPAQALAHLGAARAALAAGDPRAVLEELELAAPLGDSPVGLVLIARARLLIGDPAGAAQALDLAAGMGLHDREALLVRATIELGRGDARAAADRARDLWATGKSAEIAVVYGRALAQLGERDAARQVLTAGGGLDGGGPALVELGRLERAEGHFAAARAAYARAKSADPRSVPARLEDGLLAFELGELTSAQAVLPGLLADAPVDPLVLAACARIRLGAGDRDGARACLDQADDVPGAAAAVVVLRERGRLALALGAPLAAIEPLEAAARAAPDDAEIQLLLVDAHVGAGPAGNATDVVVRMAQHFAGQPAAEAARGREALAKGDASQAIAAFAAVITALDTLPAITPREHAEARLWLGRAQVAGKDRVHAEDSFAQAVALWPLLVDGQVELARVRLERGRLKEARQAVDGALVLDAGHATAWFLLAELERRSGHVDRAGVAYERSAVLAGGAPLAAEARRQKKLMVAAPAPAALAPDAGP